jgi:FlaA1/EpsC-like NDP-sugar epimerase
MNEILLIGAGNHTKVYTDVFEQEGKFKIAGLIEKNEKSNHILGYHIIAKDHDIEYLRKRYNYALITIGFIKIT